jgi:hypothetical protein
MQRETKIEPTSVPPTDPKEKETNRRSERVVEYVEEDEFKKNMDRITKERKGLLRRLAQ